MTTRAAYWQLLSSPGQSAPFWNLYCVPDTPLKRNKSQRGGKTWKSSMKRLLSFSSPKVFVYMIKSNRKVHLGKEWTDEAILRQTECQDQVQMPTTGRKKTSSIHQSWSGVGPRYCNHLYKTNMDKSRAPWEQGAHSLGKTGINCRAQCRVLMSAQQAAGKGGQLWAFLVHKAFCKLKDSS